MNRRECPVFDADAPFDCFYEPPSQRQLMADLSPTPGHDGMLGEKQCMARLLTHSFRRVETLTQQNFAVIGESGDRGLPHIAATLTDLTRYTVTCTITDF
ncbi:hypothetical protein PQR33_36080 [Paraburkholderia sediminicola]|uniref:hypothetical protein n=1 Tax=Paraburkholderia sediminicola TaxID=458836 RepID=UPI0038B7B1E3